ncbi:cytochrome c3 family protein [Neobacillus drentensis]|uniref:cytochrome c3 family protein n=1 Tax=Neobacillus drentensis TaxID=220684 RepID=UPI002FFDC7A3
MSKIKLSFSFLLTLMLVAMFSIMASAAGSNPVVTGDGVFPGDPAGVKAGLASDDTVHDNNYNTVDKSNANKTGSGVGGQTENFNQVIKSDDMVKNPNGSHGTQRTHGSYMNNTNSCASCHQTHTGASKNLLFKDGEYATCTACHDGTLGFYNVFTGSDSAGTFGGTHDGNMSVHLANGTVKLQAAPGGDKNASEENWEAEFTCASCHAPHGSYSDRLLHENPNDMGNITLDKGGKKLENVYLAADISTKASVGNITYRNTALATDVTVNYVLYKKTLTDSDVTGPKTVTDYTVKGLASGDTVIQLKRWNPDLKNASGATVGGYVDEKDPWLHGYGWDDSHSNKIYWTKFVDATGTTVMDTDQLKKGVIYGNGFLAVKNGNTAMLDKINSIEKGNVARAYVVKLDVSTPDSMNVATTTASSLWASKKANGSNNPGYVSGRGVAMSSFCSACHTDYLASSGKESGTFDHAYRHTTTSDSYTCVRCHYAHGTDVTIMRDARGLTYNQILGDTTNYFPALSDATSQARKDMVKDYLIDKNPSSALKRYTNMAVCWACHTSSHSEGTRNTETYQYNPTVGIDTDRNGIEFDY